MADTSGLISLAGAVISAGAAVTTVVLTRRAAVRDRQVAAAELALRYREPLLHAAFNLQTRLYNIASPTHRFLERFLTNGTPAEAEYARLNTVYLLGQYLCWSEILRREGQFIDPVDLRRDREVMAAMEQVREVLSDSLTFTGPVLRVFRGEQRAIGEVMMVRIPSGPNGQFQRECLGYASFTERLRDADFSRWFEKLRSDVTVLAREPHRHEPRLFELQHALIDLIDFLDPDCCHFPKHVRSKIERTAPANAPA